MFGAPVTVTAPDAELISLEQAKSFLRFDGASQDVEIGLAAGAAVADLEDMTGVRLLHQTVAVTADSFADLARFRVGPIRSVVEIAYRNSAGNDQVVAPADYELFGAPLEQGVRLAGTATWPATDARDAPITVTLDVGYAAAADDVPDKLRFAAFALLRAKFEGTTADVESLTANHRFWL